MDLDPVAENEELLLQSHIQFGSSAAADEVPSGDATSSGHTAEGSTASQSRSRKRKSTSPVWDDFEEVYNFENGKKVRTHAICFHCKQQFSARSSAGTGHLLRHQEACKARKERTGTQSLLRFNTDGSVVRWEYSSSVARVELCRLIAREDLPLSFGESDAFQEYIARAHNPRFVKSSRQTTARDLVKHYNDRVEKLIESLKSVSSVALTSDIWSGKAKEDYISVVAHFVNCNWELEKRLLGLRPIEDAHTGKNIAERVCTVVDEYGLTDKIFSITLDNASSNKTAMSYLTPLFSGYLGLPATSESSDVHRPADSDIASILLHQRCACHIINLIVKAGLKRLRTYVDDFRTAITFLNASNQRIAAYKSYCLSMGIPPRKFNVDMDVRWNSTYLMLKHVLPHKSTFSVFIKTQYPLSSEGAPLLTDNHWLVGEKLFSFLELFYNSTVALSGVYYPTSPLMLHHILRIARQLNAYESDELMRNAVVPMKTKFLKYWRQIPILYSFAFILDPRAKMRGFHKVLMRLAGLTGTNYSSLPQSVRMKLTQTFQLYEAKFGAVRLATEHQPSRTSGKAAEAWDDIYGDDIPGSSVSVGTTASISQSELTSYLDSDTVTQFGPDFSILSWWHDHKNTYPILSRLAKDVMTVPASTISSESTFSLAGRVIEERRRRLTCDMVEILSCIKDWELADSHMQHNVEKDTDELEALYQQEDESEAPPGTGRTGS